MWDTYVLDNPVSPEQDIPAKQCLNVGPTSQMSDQCSGISWPTYRVDGPAAALNIKG